MYSRGSNSARKRHFFLASSKSARRNYYRCSYPTAAVGPTVQQHNSTINSSRPFWGNFAATVDFSKTINRPLTVAIIKAININLHAILLYLSHIHSPVICICHILKTSEPGPRVSGHDRWRAFHHFRIFEHIPCTPCSRGAASCARCFCKNRRLPQQYFDNFSLCQVPSQGRYQRTLLVLSTPFPFGAPGKYCKAVSIGNRKAFFSRNFHFFGNFGNLYQICGGVLSSRFGKFFSRESHRKSKIHIRLQNKKKKSGISGR